MRRVILLLAMSLHLISSSKDWRDHKVYKTVADEECNPAPGNVPPPGLQHQGLEGSLSRVNCCR
jgi:hypothetical protein